MPQYPAAGSDSTLHITWTELERILSTLARSIRHEGLPDSLIAVQRGGLIPAVMLSHMLHVRTIRVVEFARTVDDTPHSRKLAPVLAYSSDLRLIRGTDALLIDDVSGTGETLRAAIQTVMVAQPRRLRTVVCLVNRANWEPVNDRPPTELVTYLGSTVAAWVVFPWEALASQ